jgi:hypothetical protein
MALKTNSNVEQLEIFPSLPIILEKVNDELPSLDPALECGTLTVPTNIAGEREEKLNSNAVPKEIFPLPTIGLNP